MWRLLNLGQRALQLLLILWHKHHPQLLKLQSRHSWQMWITTTNCCTGYITGQGSMEDLTLLHARPQSAPIWQQSHKVSLLISTRPRHHVQHLLHLLYLLLSLLPVPKARSMFTTSSITSCNCSLTLHLSRPPAMEQCLRLMQCLATTRAVPKPQSGTSWISLQTTLASSITVSSMSCFISGANQPQ